MYMNYIRSNPIIIDYMYINYIRIIIPIVIDYPYINYIRVTPIVVDYPYINFIRVTPIVINYMYIYILYDIRGNPFVIKTSHAKTEVLRNQTVNTTYPKG